MAFQERNETCGMKPECSGQNLTEKSKADRDLKWNENYFVLFYILNWYEMFPSLELITLLQMLKWTVELVILATVRFFWFFFNF